MRYKIIQPFIDINTGDRYDIGDTYESDDDERVIHLQDKGFLGDEVSDKSTSEAELNPLGGGFYELPNGEKVKGKKSALERLKELVQPPPTEKGR